MLRWSRSLTAQGSSVDITALSPRCQVGSPGEKVSCWPAPENAENLNTNCCDLGLSDVQEADLVSFLGTLTDGYAGAER